MQEQRFPKRFLMACLHFLELLKQAAAAFSEERQAEFEKVIEELHWQFCVEAVPQEDELCDRLYVDRL